MPMPGSTAKMPMPGRTAKLPMPGQTMEKSTHKDRGQA
jgi:hypothetical protein